MTKLKRHITLWPLVLYGMGDILGAGIYGLVGKAAGVMGNGIWMAFGVSMVAAAFTGLSYASLGSRYPRAGGASYIVHRAFKWDALAYVIGLCVLASGLTSMATASRVFAGYFVGLVPIASPTLVIFGFATLIAFLLFVGIRETMWANNLISVIEIAGLLIVIAVGASYLGHIDYLDTRTATNPEGNLTPALLLGGAVLTFYSFIGFEDILNVSEEVVEPSRTIPLGLILAVAGSSLIYMLISMIAVSVVPANELASSTQPLVDVIRTAAPWFPLGVYSIISLLAVSNTALLNFLMGSRLLYGMAHQGLMPKFLRGVHSTRATPHRAISIIWIILLVLALSGDIAALAKATSVLLLICFSVVNVGLVVLKKMDPRPGHFEIPSWIPIAGTLVCLGMLSQARWAELKIAGTILLGILALYFVIRPSGAVIEKMES